MNTKGSERSFPVDLVCGGVIVVTSCCPAVDACWGDEGLTPVERHLEVALESMVGFMVQNESRSFLCL
jgi:hypothetical protein